MAEEAVVERRVEPADAVRLVRLIAERSDTVAVPALRRIAARRGFRGVAKAAREAAVEELEGRTA